MEPPPSVEVVIDGPGAVRTPHGDLCRGTCREYFAYGTDFVLEAVVTEGVTFTGWEGACEAPGEPFCTVTQPGPITAHFRGGGARRLWRFGGAGTDGDLSPPRVATTRAERYPWVTDGTPVALSFSFSGDMMLLDEPLATAGADSSVITLFQDNGDLLWHRIVDTPGPDVVADVSFGPLSSPFVGYPEHLLVGVTGASGFDSGCGAVAVDAFVASFAATDGSCEWVQTVEASGGGPLFVDIGSVFFVTGHSPSGHVSMGGVTRVATRFAAVITADEGVVWLRGVENLMAAAGVYRSLFVASGAASPQGASLTIERIDLEERVGLKIEFEVPALLDVTSMVADREGGFYLAGRLDAAPTTEVQLGQVSLTAVADDNTFLLRLNRDLQPTWGRLWGDSGQSAPRVTLGQGRHPVISATFDRSEDGTSWVPGPKVAQLDRTDGSTRWMTLLATDPAGSAVITDVDSNEDSLHVTGTYAATLAVGNMTVTSAGETDVFLLKLAP